MAGSVGQPTVGWFPWVGDVSETGTWVRTNVSNRLSMGRLQNSSGALNDSVTFSNPWMDSVIWKLCVVGTKDTDHGIWTFYLNNVSQGTIDLYNNPVTYSTYNEITGLAVTTAQINPLKATVLSKNASSTNYYSDFEGIALIATSGAYSTPSGTDTPGYTWEWIPWMGAKGNLNWSTRSQSSTNLGGGRLDNDTGAQNNHVNTDAWVDTGTYTAALVGLKDPTYGIVSVQFDGSTQGTIDLYIAAGGAYNTYMTTTFSVSTAGVKNVKLLMATKNASASSYSSTVQSFKLIRTGA